jgi:hypothetical protein
MPKTMQVFELRRLTRGRKWTNATKPIHYDVEKSRVDFFLTFNEASKEGFRLGMTYVNNVETRIVETGVNEWLEKFKDGDPDGFYIKKTHLTDWNKRAKSGIPPSEAIRVHVKK